MKRILVAGIALLGTSISAQAADLSAKAPYYKAPVVAIYDWTGFYIGVNAGGGLGRDRALHTIPGNSADSLYLQPQGGLGGGQIGYNWQTNSTFLGPLVFGVEADIQAADMRDGRTSINGLGGIVASYNQRLDWFGTVRGRVGLVTGPVLSYVTAGYAYGNVRTGVTEAFGGVTSAFSTNRMEGGYVIGSGVEAALGGNWTGKIEYLNLNLGNRTDAFTALGIPQTLTSELRENIFRAGLNYRIGGNSVYTPVAASNWTGFYLGGNVGSGTGRDRTSLAIVGGGTDLFNVAPDGINGGVQAGYNWQVSNLVFGVEADIQASSQRDNKTCLTCLVFLGAAYDTKLPWFGTVRGKLGYAVGSSLFYATGGYAYGKIKTDVTTSVGGIVTANSFSATKDGWTVGGGIETPFTLLGLFGPSWTTKTEYLYVDLGTTANTFTNAGITATNSTRVTEHIFRTGLNYHFNSPVVAKY